jgi:hypothetical protein
MVDDRFPRSQSDRYGNRDQYGDSNRSPYGDRGSYDRDGSDRNASYGSQDGRGGYDRDRYGYQGQGGNDRYYGTSAQSDRGYGQSYGQNDGRSYGAAQGDRFQGGNDRGGYDRGHNDRGQSQGYGATQPGYGRDRDQGQRGGYGGRPSGQGGYGRQPQGYDYEERGFFDRAGDEVRSWFGDDEAQRRRDFDARYDDQRYGNTDRGHHDEHYGSWRRSQIEALDRDYDEYRRENRSRFESEFSSWRDNRQTQRSSLSKVTEHMDVVGSDGAHVGTVDKVRGDRIILTKNDADAGGRHHSIPSSWLQTVDDKVTIAKTAEDAKAHWRDEENNQALFGQDDKDRPSTENKINDGPHTLNKSFGGTY